MFYDRFELLCKEKGVSPTSVARENGITQQSVSLWKKRGSTPKAETIQKLADYFGVPVDYLLGINQLPKTKSGISSAEQELSAILNFLQDLGYVLLNVLQDSAAAVILDRRLNKWYEIPIEELCEVERSITTFSKFQINEVLSKYTPMKHLNRNVFPMPPEAPQSPQTQTEGKDTPPQEPPPAAPQDPPEGTEAPLKSEEIDWGPPRGEEVW